MSIEMNVYGNIRRIWVEGKSIRAIAKECNVSRQTVRKYCEGKTLPNDRKAYHREPSVLTQEIVEFVRTCLDAENNSSQRMSAKKIYDLLCAEMGFNGCYSTVRGMVKRLKEEQIEE